MRHSLPLAMVRRPLEIINVLTISILLALTILGAISGRFDAWPLWTARLLIMLGITLFMGYLAREEQGGSSFRRILVNVYPLALVPAVFDSLGRIITAVHPVLYDPPLAWMDRYFFGVDPTIWLQRFVWPPLSDLFYLAYSTYYFFPVVITLALWPRNKPLAKLFIFSIAFGFYLSYAGYFLVPAVGPRYYLHPTMQDLAASPISRFIADTLNAAENTKQDAFPSGHTMITLMCLIWAQRYTPRIFWFMLPVGTLLIGATVYCRYHYVIDVFIGALLAVLAVPLARWAYVRLGGENTGPAAAPDGCPPSARTDA